MAELTSSNTPVLPSAQMSLKPFCFPAILQRTRRSCQRAAFCQNAAGLVSKSAALLCVLSHRSISIDPFRTGRLCVTSFHSAAPVTKWQQPLSGLPLAPDQGCSVSCPFNSSASRNFGFSQTKPKRWLTLVLPPSLQGVWHWLQQNSCWFCTDHNNSQITWFPHCFVFALLLVIDCWVIEAFFLNMLPILLNNLWSILETWTRVSMISNVKDLRTVPHGTYFPSRKKVSAQPWVYS